jgi:hypothetical protein
MRRATCFLLVLVVAAGFSGCSGLSDAKHTGGGGNPGAITVTVAPQSPTAVVNQTVAFQATVTGTTNTAVIWKVNGVTAGNSTVGTINASGAYTAPATVPNPSTVMVTAVSQADSTKSGSSNVLIVPSNSNQMAQNIPVKLGTSGGNAKDSSLQSNLTFCCSGTLGALVQRNGTFYILSNNHVLARSDSASIGDAITQPGLIDANCSSIGTTTVGNLSQFVNLQTSGTNVDAAIAQIVTGTVDTTGSILSLGATATGSVADAGPPHAGPGITATIGENVAKSGRSTGLTCSSVSSISLATSIVYQQGCSTGSTFTVNFTNQISVTGGSFSASGDSGSLIVDETTADPVALLFGGSDTDTVGNPVAEVLAALVDQSNNKPAFVGSAATHQVIGCTLPANGVKTTESQTAIALDPVKIASAERARDMHAPELLANTYVQAIGVGPSIDRPGEAAVILVVNPGQIPTALPAELEGVGTRIVAAGNPGPHGVFDTGTAARVAPVLDTFAVNSITKSELERARVVHSAHVSELLKQHGIQGVGITSSADSPGEAALMIFVIRGVAHDPIPVVIDGLRTRVRESSRFTAGKRGEGPVRGCSVPTAKSPLAVNEP